MLHSCKGEVGIEACQGSACSSRSGAGSELGARRYTVPQFAAAGCSMLELRTQQLTAATHCQQPGWGRSCQVVLERLQRKGAAAPAAWAAAEPTACSCSSRRSSGSCCSVGDAAAVGATAAAVLQPASIIGCMHGGVACARSCACQQALLLLLARLQWSAVITSSRRMNIGAQGQAAA